MRKNIVFKNAYLIKKSDGFIVGKLNLTNDYETALSCDVYSAIAWDGQTLEPTEYDFAFHAGIKWDGCSHFNFYGQDYETAVIYCIISIRALYRNNADNTD